MDTFRPAVEPSNSPHARDNRNEKKVPRQQQERITIIMDESIRNLKKAASVRAFKCRPSSIYQQKTKALSTSATPPDEQRVSAAIENTSTTAAGGLPPGEQQQQRGPESVPTAAEQIRELQKMYLFGLMRVSELEDLQKAPDAILFGNFCGTESTVVAPR